MQLIADSGSTKTTWCLIKGSKKLASYRTIGYNPHYHTSESIAQNLRQTLIPHLECSPNELLELHFYGAGISTPDTKEILRLALEQCFPTTQLEVAHDMLGAARALCGQDAGVACILGTGSNSCYYDGKEVLDNIDALGFLLGDEGGGGNLGRLLIKAYYYRDLPSDLRKAFDAKYKLTKSILFDNVYKKPMPNRYVANFSRFCGAHRSHPFIQDLLRTNFENFIGRQVLKYPKAKNIPIHFVGSIAYIFQEELEAVLELFNLEIGNILQEPMDGLFAFHI